MEDLEKKLNSNDPTVIPQIFSKIIQNIEDKAEGSLEDSNKLKFILDKSVSSDPLVSGVAAESVIYLVKKGHLPVEYIITDYITKLPLTKCFSSLIHILANLFVLENRNNFGRNIYNTAYDLHFPQHPFITILIENPSSSNLIINKIKVLQKDDRRSIGLFKPVYIFSLCNPVQTNSLDLFSYKLWCNLISNNDEQIFYDVFGWLQLQTKHNVETVSDLLNEALTYASTNDSSINIELIILWKVSILHYLTIHKLDISGNIFYLVEYFQNNDSVVTINCVVLMLAKTIDICPPMYLKHLLDLCDVLVHKYTICEYILETLKATLLPWLASPCLLLDDTSIIAKRIFAYTNSDNIGIEENNQALRAFVEKHDMIITSNKDVFTSLKICLTLKSNENISLWVKKLNTVPDNFINQNFYILCGIFLVDGINSKIVNELLVVILKHIQNNFVRSSKFLTIILYKLSNTKQPDLHFRLLKSLPKMVLLRDNISKVMATLLAVGKSSVDLFNLSLSLMYEAWNIDSKCYSYLETMLVRDCFSQKKWEFYITKTYIIKQLCQKKPELYGKDMVAHLSKILNECNDDNGSLSSALAIEGIKLLCRAEVIDIVTTWATLSPKFKNDNRVPVIISICDLIKEIPHLSYTEAYVELYQDVVNRLWEYIEFGDPDICEAAFNSLSSFSLDQICTNLPEKYLEDSELERNNETQLVPGKTWITFLKRNGASKQASNFIIKLMSAEIDGYLKFIYQVKGPKEPVNYNYLPIHSVVRAIGEFVKTWANKWKGIIHNKLYIECLKILGVEYSKPLPPLDWCFLQELMHDSNSRDCCVDIASHQVMLSGTARRLMENCIVAVTENMQEQDAIVIFKNLKHLSNSIQPMILKPFLQNTFALALNKYSDYDTYLLESILKITTAVLNEPTIQETNKMSIGDVICDNILNIDPNSEVFDAFLPCVTALPNKYIEDITKLETTSTEDWVKRAIKIRCTIAINTKISPLNWINNILDVSTSSYRSMCLNEIIKVFKIHINNPTECALWLLELIGQIQAKVADRCEEEDIIHYFDVFILTVVEFSGYSIFCKKYSKTCMQELFPAAFASLLENDGWSVCTNQALEWLHHMNTEESIPKVYRVLFALTLQNLRHNEEFMLNQRWMKYLS